jgi:hypothetical protein
MPTSPVYTYCGLDTCIECGTSNDSSGGQTDDNGEEPDSTESENNDCDEDENACIISVPIVKDEEIDGDEAG